MIKVPVILLSLLLLFSAQADNNSVPDTGTLKEKTWWQKRQYGDNIFYPHKVHMKLMEDGGDACMLCHPFSPNKIRDEKILQQLRDINNEPLKAICHDCHVEKRLAPSECRLCHLEPSSIWPPSHNYDYKKVHGEDAWADQNNCRECHKSLSFCTDCHFKRDFTGASTHPPAYKSLHGLDARMAPAECGKCHQASYCSDCHRGRP